MMQEKQGRRRIVTPKRVLIVLAGVAWLVIVWIAGWQQAAEDVRKLRRDQQGQQAPTSAQEPGADNYGEANYFISLSGPQKRMDASASFQPDSEHYKNRMPVEQFLKTAHEVEMLTVEYRESGKELWTLLYMSGEVEFKLPEGASADERAEVAERLKGIDGVRDVKEGLAELDTERMGKAMENVCPQGRVCE